MVAGLAVRAGALRAFVALAFVATSDGRGVGVGEFGYADADDVLSFLF